MSVMTMTKERHEAVYFGRHAHTGEVWAVRLEERAALSPWAIIEVYGPLNEMEQRAVRLAPADWPINEGADLGWFQRHRREFVWEPVDITITLR